MERAEKKKRRTAKKAARQRSIAKANRSGTASHNDDAASRPTTMRRTASSRVSEASAAAMAGFASSVTGILRGRTGTLSRRRGSAHEGDGDRGENGAANRNDNFIELDELARPQARRQGTGATAVSAPGAVSGTGARAVTTGDVSTPQVGFSASTYSGSQGRNQISSNSETSSTSNTPSLNPPRTVGQFLSYPTTWLWVYLRQLRRAHEDAAKKQAVARAERRQKVFGEHVAGKSKEGPRVRSPDEVELGWGLGAFGIREHEEGERRLQEAGERLREDRLLPVSETDPSGLAGAADGAAGEVDGPVAAQEEEGDPGPSSLQHRHSRLAEATDDDGAVTPSATPRINEERAGHDNEGESGGTTPRPRSIPTQTQTQAQAQVQSTSRNPIRTGRGRDEEWTDVDSDSDSDSDSSESGGRRRRRRNRNRNRNRNGDGDGDEDGADGAGKSWSWWGPLKKWRLADRSTF